jgi:transcriptional regulator with XRE-family HTH domain
MSPERKGRRTVLPDGEEVRRLRHARGWSQQNLADKAGLQPKTISNVERGKALYADTARRVAHALGVETEDLLLAPGRNESIPEDSPRGGAVGLLPPLPSLVVGRNDAVRALKERLGISRSGDGTLTMRPITVIHGIPGVDKTTVAAVLAYDSQVSAGFPDGVL